MFRGANRRGVATVTSREVLKACQVPSCRRPIVASFWRRTNGKALNSHYCRVVQVIANRLKLGLTPLGVFVICKAHKCYEYASLGVSLHYPVENGWSHYLNPSGLHPRPISAINFKTLLPNML